MKKKTWLILAFSIISCSILFLIFGGVNRLIKLKTDASDLNADGNDYEQLRLDMTKRAAKMFNLVDEDVLNAVRKVPRHQFVPEDVRHLAYSDAALPIGYGQTISAPYMVVWMTEELEIQPGQRVLEIGTGSGYQAAVLAEMGFVDVYSIEIVPELAKQAEAILNALGYDHLHLTQGDGYFGWIDHAPFDAIIVTAAPDHLPAPLIQQLAEGGRLLIPIGPTGGYQTMWKFRKVEGVITASNLGGVLFVPLISHQAPQPMDIPDK